jgi:GDP-mannose 6-dehydrogenase
MNIAVLGMGYVGCVSAACLADMGHQVIGVDVDPHKLEMLRRHQPPIVEPGLDGLLKTVMENGRLTVTDDTSQAVRQADVTMICVGTPSRPNGSLETGHLDRVVQQVGAALENRDRYRVVAVRSTLLPGVLAERIIPALENASGLKAGADFGVCVNPEFLRESTAIADFRNPPFTLIGALDGRSGEVLADAYSGLAAAVYCIPPDAAAMVKYASNAYHALKVAFGNEIGAICRTLSIDSHQVMKVFSEDRHLNISAAYLRPGFAFGGSCLPKDVRALLYAARQRDVQTPLLGSLIPSNDVHIQRVVDLVTSYEKRHVALLGLSFKPGTDDLRESPLVRLAETLVGKGFRLAIYDEEVSMSNLFGRNREYIERHLPHLAELLRTDLPGMLAEAEVLLIGKKVSGLDGIRTHLRSDQIVIDLLKHADWTPATQTSIV